MQRHLPVWHRRPLKTGREAVQCAGSPDFVLRPSAGGSIAVARWARSHPAHAVAGGRQRHPHVLSLVAHRGRHTHSVRRGRSVSLHELAVHIARRYVGAHPVESAKAWQTLVLVGVRPAQIASVARVVRRGVARYLDVVQQRLQHSARDSAAHSGTECRTSRTPGDAETTGY